MPKLQSVETFVRVAELSSFTKAADALDISRTMASQHVADLEAELGAKLLNRTTRRVSLTEAGESYLESARHALELLEDAGTQASDLAASPRGKLRVSAPVSFGTHHLAPLLPSFADAYPEIAIDLVLSDRTVDLIEEGFDLAVRIGRLADSSFRARRLATARMVVAASPAYLAAHGTPRAPTDLSAHRCLAYAYWSDRTEWRFDGPEGPEAVSIDGRVRANNGEALTRMALDGMGVVLQPTFILHDALRSGELVALLPDHRPASLDVHALYPPDRRPPTKTRLLIDHLASAYGDPPPWERSLSTVPSR